MTDCEHNTWVGWYQRPCNKPARYKVTRKVTYLDKSQRESTMLVCSTHLSWEQRHRRSEMQAVEAIA